VTINIIQAGPERARETAIMAGELLAEIMDAIHYQAFRFDLADAETRLRNYLSDGTYDVFIAVDESVGPQAVGFASVYGSRAIYAEGVFGTIPELYVRPEYRQRGIGKKLIEALEALGVQRGWERLEVTTPPLPEFHGTLAFYEREGFTVTGGRKLQLRL
jgi:GNAT superfamily N-acetyltransferase